MRVELAQQIPPAVLDMHAHWLPLRLSVHQREVAKSLQPKVGRIPSVATVIVISFGGVNGGSSMLAGTLQTGKSLAFVDAPACHAAQRCEAAGVGIEQHLVTLAGVSHPPEGPTGAQLHV